MDSTPQLEKQLQQELDKVAKQYGGGEGVDMTKFPSFSFQGKLFWLMILQYGYILI